MKRLFIVIALTLFIGSIAAAQTCTPIRLTKTDNYNDTNGPGVSIGIALGNGPTFYYEPGTVLNYAAGSQAWIYSEGDVEAGYVAVFGGFGGCMQPLDYQIRHYIQMWDMTTGKLWWTGQQGANDFTNCGLVAICQFNTIWNNASGGFSQGRSIALGVVPGHTYQIRDYMAAYINNVGLSEWYNSYITLQVQ